MIYDKWWKKIGALADAMELDADQMDIMTQWFDNNFVELGHRQNVDFFRYGSEELIEATMDGIRKQCAGKIGEVMYETKNILSIGTTYSDEDGEQQLMSLIAFKGGTK
jgi:hypothetical protein